MSKKILIVDDDVELCEEMLEIMKDEGFIAESVDDGVKAKEMIERNNYDVVLLDIKIPNMDGISLLKYFRDKNISSKIYLTSGRPFLDKVLREEGAVKQLAGVFSKPFDIAVILKEIKNPPPA